tara:strand:+ start:268 stop:768 length:501 start_codon:yes stop_codon:yes gene_type:complete
MSSINLNDIDVFVFDFDGVLTNNKVLIDSSGLESVICSRSDGLAFDVLKTLKIQSFILSTEKNKVVEMRAKKLNIKAYYGVKDKLKSLNDLVNEHKFKKNRIFYVGNDLNDYFVMQECGYTACPSDSHPKIKSISDYVCQSKGGDGIVREVLEDVFKIDFIEILYK